MVILPDWTVKGGWKGEFFIDRYVDFQVMTCNFKGFLDPKQVYRDEQGDNPTKLFFINKGNFMILETNSESGRVRNLMGDAYVRGWIDIDYTVNGELIFTTDEKNFYRYTWQGKATEAKTLLLDSPAIILPEKRD